MLPFPNRLLCLPVMNTNHWSPEWGKQPRYVGLITWAFCLYDLNLFNISEYHMQVSKWWWTCLQSQCLLPILNWFWYYFSCRSTLLFLTLSSVRPSYVSTTMSLCLCLHTPLLARLSVLSECSQLSPSSFTTTTDDSIMWSNQIFSGVLLPVDMPLLWPSERSREWSLPAPSKLSPIRNTERCTRSFRMWAWWLEMSPSIPRPPASLWQQRWDTVGGTIRYLCQMSTSFVCAVWHNKPISPQILRSMLYRGSEIMREVAWVIFDEIHYMRDSGV